MRFLQRQFPGDDGYEGSDCGNARGLPWFLAILFFCLTGCALTPDTVHLAAVHQSQPMRGMGPAPFGGEELMETTFEAIELGARWEDGHRFAETSFSYVVHETYLEGGPWIFTAKAGVRWDVPK